MSVAMKRNIAIGVAAFVVLLVGVKVYQKVTGSPSDKALLNAVRQKMGSPNVDFAGLTRAETAVDDLHVQGTLTAKGVLSDALYEKVDTAAFLQQNLQADVLRLNEVRKSLSGAAGAKIRELAGIADVPENPLDAVIIKETSAKGTAFSFEGGYQASKIGGGWQINVNGAVQNDVLSGSFRGAFAGSVILADNQTDQARLKKMLTDFTAFEQHITAATEQYKEILKKERAARLAQLISNITPGNLYKGSATNRYNQSVVPLWLEFTNLNQQFFQVTALLRNDGGWQDARVFQGEFSTDPGVEKLSVNIGTRNNQAINSAGPIVQDNDSWNIPFQLNLQTGELTGNTNGYVYRFIRVSDADLPAEEDALKAPLKAILDTCRTGLVFKGTILNKRDQSTEVAFLNILKVENDGALVAARIDSDEHPNWRRSLRGTLIVVAIAQKAFPFASGWTTGIVSRAPPTILPLARIIIVCSSLFLGIRRSLARMIPSSTHLPFSVPRNLPRSRQSAKRTNRASLRW